MQAVVDCNNVVEAMKKKKVTLRTHSIPEQDVRHVLIADSSFDPSGRTTSARVDSRHHHTTTECRETGSGKLDCMAK